MNKKEKIKENNTIICDTKIDCHKLTQWLTTLFTHNKQDMKSQLTNFVVTCDELYNDLIKEENIEQSRISKTTFLLDLRTCVCYQMQCKYVDRNHRRITRYNYNKLISSYVQFEKKLEDITKQLIILWIKENDLSTYKPKYVNFVKASMDTDSLTSNSEKYKPIANLYNTINEIVEYNSETTMKKRAAEAPGNKINENNKIRMTYGDINYLGGNKAIFYFNRGKRGTQIFTNSMYSIKKQASDKDIVVIDDIVFTSSCKCDSALQHKTMFPHYRVTCAVGLTCPAKLNNIEKIIYARNHHACTETYTTARAMLVRFW